MCYVWEKNNLKKFVKKKIFFSDLKKKNENIMQTQKNEKRKNFYQTTTHRFDLSNALEEFLLEH